ncbi:MAG: L-threonylcarbamoyladenylate synthase [Patescibacteria group bacterium]|jgi:L-threonylcarbamoyladenylate synthase
MKILKLNLKLATEVKINQVIKEAITTIKNGGLVIYPTETIYGMAANPHDQQAINKLLKYKNRREGKPLSIAVSKQAMAEQYVIINQQAQNFYQRFLPGPYTVISQLRVNSQIDQRVASEFGTLGIRIPDYPLMLKLIEHLGHGITATSANASNKKRPYRIKDVLNNISEKQKQLIDLIIDVGQLAKNEPSVVIDTSLSTPLSMRGQLRTNDKFIEFNSQSESETQGLAMRLILKNLNNLKKQGLLFGLSGELGVGKTIFAKGAAKFLKIKEEITSPTYTYLNEYTYQKGTLQGIFYHLDAWKIDQEQEFSLLKVDQLLKANNILLIEWWDKIANFLPDNLKKQAIILDLSGQDNWRKIKLWEKTKK